MSYTFLLRRTCQVSKDFTKLLCLVLSRSRNVYSISPCDHNTHNNKKLNHGHINGLQNRRARVFQKTLWLIQKKLYLGYLKILTNSPYFYKIKNKKLRIQTGKSLNNFKLQC